MISTKQTSRSELFWPERYNSAPDPARLQPPRVVASTQTRVALQSN